MDTTFHPRAFAPLPPATAPTSKLDGIASTPDNAAALVRDSSAASAVLLEGLLPGGWNAERARALAAAVRERAERLRSGDTSDLETDLAGQLEWLKSLAAYAIRRGTADDVSPAAADIWFRMAMRAQRQFAQTVAAFALVNRTNEKAEV